MREYHIKTGDRFNRLTAIKLDRVGKHNRSYFLFRCDCGIEKVILGSQVKSGNTKSCGCLSREVKKAKLLPNNAGVINQIILSYKRHAKTRGFAWGLTFTDVSNIINKPCHYCGILNSNKKITKNCKDGFCYNGIDRVNSKKDYTIDNVVPCCDFCNKAKGSKTKEEFLSWVKRIYKNAMAEQWG
jgi:5-methylcytosine-specific restriction endonuclease McrA